MLSPIFTEVEILRLTYQALDYFELMGSINDPTYLWIFHTMGNIMRNVNKGIPLPHGRNFPRPPKGSRVDWEVAEELASGGYSPGHDRLVEVVKMGGGVLAESPRKVKKLLRAEEAAKPCFSRKSWRD